MTEQLLLEPTPTLDPIRAARCRQIQGLVPPLDRRMRNGFVVDFIWGSSQLANTNYVRGMAAFCELGDMQVIEQTFILGYARSVLRASPLPTSLRSGSLDIDAIVQALADFISTGKRPADPVAAAYLR